MANFITLSRIALIIPFIAAFLSDTSWGMTAALVIFALASVTDFLDGWVARARGEVSALGAALDPLADKLLVAAALLLLVHDDVIKGFGVIAALIILLREVALMGFREAMVQFGGVLPVTSLAKWKTTAQLIAIAALIAAASDGLIGEAALAPANGLLWLAAFLTFWTGADYAWSAAQYLRKRDKSDR